MTERKEAFPGVDKAEPPKVVPVASMSPLRQSKTTRGSEGGERRKRAGLP